MFKALKKHIGKQLRDLKLLKFHLKNISFEKASKKRIIVCFNGVVPHGGLVDRLKGIVSFYNIAKQLDYEFYIQFNNPFLLTEFLESNKVDWRINDSDVTYNMGSTKIINCINSFDFNPLNEIKNSNKSTFLVYANIDYLASINSNLNTIEVETLWRNHFKYLFKLSPKLNEALQQLQANTYNSFHTRFTSLMGDFTDSTSVYLNENEKKQLLESLNKQVSQLIKQANKPLYAFSDSALFLEYISEKNDIKTLKGIPFHMDNYNGGSTLEAHLKTMLDFFTIVNSNEVYFLKVGKMYNSAFSKYAAIIGDKPFTKIEA